MTRVGIVAAVIIIIVASIVFGFRKAARDHAVKPLEHARPFRKIDPESRKLLLVHIEEARAKRAVQPELSKDYIRRQLTAIAPLLTACHETDGRVVMKLTIGGEPDIGGLVETAEVDAAQSAITHPATIACVRETLYAVEFVAPVEGGRVELTYPFELRSAAN